MQRLIRLLRALKALNGHDRGMLLAKAKQLKQSDGEGLAVGHVVEALVQ